jgi:4-amino-4-deoxy-L-arabinose transferase-like glycosyltransferase
LAPNSTLSPATAALLVVFCILFFLSGLAVIPYIGIQTDEAIFTSVLFDNSTPWFTLSIFKKKLPLMVMSYIGCVKSWLYWFLWQVVDPCVYSLRVPTLLAGVASILSAYFLIRRAADSRVAIFAAALLATDPSYIMTSTFDWGPVAVQHLCLTGGLLFLIKSYQTSNLRSLAGGSFLLGLGMWDKALFAWMLSGAVVATPVIFFKEIKRFLTVRRITVAGFFFVLGILPLLIYNVRRPLETFRGNTRFSSLDLSSKLLQIPATAKGNVLFGYVFEEDHARPQREPGNSVERASVGLSRLVGERRASLNWYALAAALLASPVLLFTRYRRPVLFCLLMMAVAWGQMLATQNAGGGAHHTILLWPFPLMLIAMAAVALSSKLGRFEVPFLSVAAITLCTSSMLVNNHYLAQAIRNGAAGPWTNAHFNLVAKLPSYRSEKIFLTDWGMLDNTRMLFRGKLPLEVASEPLMHAEPTAEDLRIARYLFDYQNAIFVSNTDHRQIFPEVNPRLKRLAAQIGYERELLEVIYDFNGRPSYEISRFHKRDNAGLTPNGEGSPPKRLP